MGCQVSWIKSTKKKQVGEHLIPTANIPSLTQLTQTSTSPQPEVAQTIPPETPQVSQSLPTTTSNHHHHHHNDILPSPSAGRVGFNNHFRQVRNLDLEIQQNTISQAFVYGSPPRQSHTSIPYYTPSPPIDIPHRHSPRSNIVPFQNPPYPIDIPHRYSPQYPTIPTGFHYSKSNRTPPSHSPSQGSLYSTQRQQNDYHMDSHVPRFIANYSDHSAPFLLQEEHVSQLHLDHEPTSPPFDPTSEYPMSSLPFPPIYDQADSPRSFNFNNRNSVLGLDLDPEQVRSATNSSGSLPNYLVDHRITSSALARHNENYDRGIINSTSHVPEGNRSASRPSSPAFSVRHEQDGKLFIARMGFLKSLKKIFTRKPKGNQEEYSMVNFPHTVSDSLQQQPRPLKHEQTPALPSRSGGFVVPHNTDTIIPEQFLTLPSNPPSNQIPYRGELVPEDLESTPKYAPELRCQVDDAIIGTNSEDDVPSTPLPPYTPQSVDHRVYYTNPRTGSCQTNYNVPGHSYYTVTHPSTNLYPQMPYRDAGHSMHMHHLHGPPGPRNPHRREQPVIQIRSCSSEIPRNTPADFHHPLRT